MIELDSEGNRVRKQDSHFTTRRLPNYVLCWWDLNQSGGDLDLRNQEKLVFKFNDDFTGVVEHTYIQGLR